MIGKWAIAFSKTMNRKKKVLPKKRKKQVAYDDENTALHLFYNSPFRSKPNAKNGNK